MKDKHTVWVVITFDTDTTSLTSKKVFKSQSEAFADVHNWFDSLMEEYNEDGYEPIGEFNCGHAQITHNGWTEVCEAFEVEVE